MYVSPGWLVRLAKEACTVGRLLRVAGVVNKGMDSRTAGVKCLQGVSMTS